mgnify:CR=1 FL=1|jgi:hypothetical protein
MPQDHMSLLGHGSPSIVYGEAKNALIKQMILFAVIAQQYLIF